MANINEENEVVKNDESIFTDDDFAVDIYNKRIKNAKIAILGCAIWVLFNLIVVAVQNSNSEFIWIDIILWTVFIVGFILLWLWAKYKPYSAIIGTLILLGCYIAINAAFNISTLWGGIILKIIIISTLVAGLSDAKDAQERMALKNN